MPRTIDLDAAADMIMGPFVTRYFFMGGRIAPNDVGRFVEAALYGIIRL